MTQMVRHSFTLDLPTSTPWAEVENIVHNQIVIPHMLRAGKNSFADLHLLSGIGGPVARKVALSVRLIGGRLHQ